MRKKFNNWYRLGVGMMALVGLGVALVMPAGVANGGKTAPPVTFTWAELSPLPSASSATAVAMNNLGDVVGSSGGDAVLWPAANLWAPVDVTNELAVLAPTYSGFSVEGINDSGQMAGDCQYVDSAGTTHNQAFFYDPNPTPPRFLVATVPSGWEGDDNDMSGSPIINKNGVVAGNLLNSSYTGEEVFVWVPATGAEAFLQSPDGDSFFLARGINDSGQVLASENSPLSRAVLCTPDAQNPGAYNYVPIQPLGQYSETFGWGLNNLGEVAGEQSSPNAFPVAITYTSSGGIVSLNTKNMYESRARSVNDAGQVVGWYLGTNAWNKTAGFFLYIPGNGVFQLSQLTINPPPGMTNNNIYAQAIITNPPSGKTYGHIAINASTGIPYILLPQN